MSTSYRLPEEDRRIVWEQFVEVYAQSQASFDESVRILAAAGVGIVASLATALHKVGTPGEICVSLFLLSLGMNVISYVTTQFDMRARLRGLSTNEHHNMEGTGWTAATHALNALAGLMLLAGGSSLAWFVSWAT